MSSTPKPSPAKKASKPITFNGAPASQELIDAVAEYDGVPPSCPARIQRAYGRIKSSYFHTPTRLIEAHNVPQGYDVRYKCELQHWTGSFKERGALNTLLQLKPEQMKKGVIAASAGNHALALAFHGRRLGIPVTVVMPTIAPLTKIERCQSFGARVIVQGETIAESRRVCDAMVAESGQFYVNGFDHPRIVNGAGTVGVEIMEQLPDVDAIVVPVGGAGLIAGIALAVKFRNPTVKVIAVESEACPSYSAAIAAGKPVETPVKTTIADGLHVPTVGAHSFYVSRKYVDETIVVSERHISQAVLHILENDKMVCEGAGAAGVAALLSGQLEHLRGMKTAIVLCGGNIDVTALGRVIERGLAMSKRLIRFTSTVPDRPGGLAEFAVALAKTGASVKDIMQERPIIVSNKTTILRVTIETKSAQHADQVVREMADKGFQLAIDVDHMEKPNTSEAQQRHQQQPSIGADLSKRSKL